MESLVGKATGLSGELIHVPATPRVLRLVLGTLGLRVTFTWKRKQVDQASVPIWQQILLSFNVDEMIALCIWPWRKAKSNSPFWVTFNLQHDDLISRIWTSMDQKWRRPHVGLHHQHQKDFFNCRLLYCIAWFFPEWSFSLVRLADKNYSDNSIM